MKHDHVLKNVNFDRQGLGVGEWYLWAKYLLQCSNIRYSLKFDMQHDHVMKQIVLLTPRVVLVGSVGKIFATMLLHLLFN